MDFDFNEDQRLLKETIDRFCLDQYGFEQRKKHVASENGWSRAVWGQLAAMGMLGLPFAEEQGGFAGGPVETMIVMEALGRALVVEPYLPTVILGGGFLRRGAPATLRDAVIPHVMDGSCLLAFAHVERNSRFELNTVEMTAKKDGEGWLLDGRKYAVLGGDAADKVFVTARVSGAAGDRDGIGLFLVDSDTDGLSRLPFTAQNGQGGAVLTFESAHVGADAEIGVPGAALPLVERVVDEAMTAMMAEAVGAMETLLDLTVDYLKSRTQFGRPLGAFQAIQHRAADMLIAVQQARSLMFYATMMLDAEDPEERAKAISAAKLQVGRAARFVGENAIQLHGGIGMTMEYQAGHYFKRLTMIDVMFGDAEEHLDRLTAKGGFGTSL
jgi:pimeloyl-CoA dehydrogenase small subunit